MNVLLVPLVVGLLLCSCGPAARRAPNRSSHGEARFHRIVGVASTDIRGEGITMTLNFECVRTVTDTYCDELVHMLYADAECVQRTLVTREEPFPCHWSSYADLQLTLTPPWSREPIAGLLGAGRMVRFPVEWRKTGMDPLRDDARARLASSWLIGTHSKVAFRWKPSEGALESILSHIGDATDTQAMVQSSDGPVTLVVTSFALEGGALRAGTRTRLQLTIKNEGPGTAYRVIARTRSGIRALHKLQLSFGTLRPREAKTRVATVEIGGSVTHDSALVLVLVGDAHDNHVSHRQRLPVVTANVPGDGTTASCPTGVLTRTRYEEKLARMTVLLETGAISQEEFDDHEAALLRCLE
jgi:hypothetical protein